MGVKDSHESSQNSKNAVFFMGLDKMVNEAIKAMVQAKPPMTRLPKHAINHEAWKLVDTAAPQRVHGGEKSTMSTCTISF
ncbi:unnamed protein product [Urochloa humidicola]